MIYILLIIILVSILYYKYNEITNTYLVENFGNFSLLANKGLLLEVPLYKEYIIGSIIRHTLFPFC